jgi:transposase InsO family protein
MDLRTLADEIRSAAHGTKTALVERRARELGCSPKTLYAQLKPIMSVLRSRKRRSDAGTTSLNRSELLWVAAAHEETRRQTGTGTLPLDEVIAVGRANGRIRAERIDAATGELKPLSTSTVRRGLRQHHMHESALAAATPAARLASLHPNHVWQIDASVSRQFYLADDGTRVMPKSEFYRGKPGNFTRIADRRLWRYIVTDHASGVIEPFYVLGAESAANLLSALIHAMTQRPTGTMHGVPKILMADPGSAVNAEATRTFCRSLGVELLVHGVGNARVTGQVEKSHHLVETHFEALLKFAEPVRSLEAINRFAQEWAYRHNATRAHTRTGMSRRDGWLRITREQLVLAPSIDVLRELAHSKPRPSVVRDCMVRLKNEMYDTRGIPGLVNGMKVDVIVNALDPESSVRVLLPGTASDQPVQYVAPRIPRGEHGFLATAATIGVEFRSPPETPADAARKELDRVAMEVRTDEEAKAARKAKRLPFGGTIDPLKHLRQVDVPPHLPRAGTPAQVAAVSVVAAQRIEPELPKRDFPPYSHAEAIRTILPLLAARGLEWSAAMLEDTVARYPEGVPYDELETWTEALWQRHRLQVVRTADGAGG